MAKKKVPAKKAPKKKASAAKLTARPKSKVAAKKAASKTSAKSGKKVRAKINKKVRARIMGPATPAGTIAFPHKGRGAETGGQSGDTEGLSGAASADSESVEELAEEGQAFEAEAISGIENVPDADEGEVTTHEVPEDDIPEEYTDED